MGPAAWLPLLLTVLLLPDLALAQVQTGSFFNGQGPGPRTGPAGIVQSADALHGGTEAGAVQVLLPDYALGPNTYFAAAPNGGVWITRDSGGSWKALTDNQSS